MTASTPTLTGRLQQKYQHWKQLLTGSIAHFIHDGFSDTLYILFPLWQAQFGLSFAEVGLLKTMFSGTLATFQVPSGYLAARLGEARLLLLGTLLTCLAFAFFSLAAAPLLLGILLIVGGLGESVQHPLSSSLISNAYNDVKERRQALSTFNFAGDLGKMALPAAAAFFISLTNWQTAVQLIAGLGFVALLLIFILTRNLPLTRPASSGKKVSLLLGWNGHQGFWSLASIGVIDSATRMGFLTLFPFILTGKGASIAMVGLALTLVFAGGATGKLACGLLATRVGVLRSVIATEVITSLLIAGILFLPLNGAMLLAPLLGVALNGTSSVLYGSVPELVGENKRNQAFAIFYTATIGAGAVSPFLYGLVSDMVGLYTTLLIIASVVLLTLPLTGLLRGKLAN